MTDARPRGRFVWFDLLTPSPEGALAFYPTVTGWGTMPFNGPTYTMWMNGEAPIGGVMALPAPHLPPSWLAYTSTPDIDETVTQAVALGARVMTPSTPIPEVGRFAILTDPQGAAFAVFTPNQTAPGHEGPPARGEFSWHELATHDHPAALRFYAQLFGWETMDAMDMGEGGTYQMFGRNGLMLGGMFNTSPAMPAPPGWLHYVMVDDVEQAVAAVTSNGGKLLNGPMEVPGGDWIAQCLDPQGAMFAVHARKK